MKRKIILVVALAAAFISGRLVEFNLYSVQSEILGCKRLALVMELTGMVAPSSNKFKQKMCTEVNSENDLDELLTQDNI